jgi:hypothetical protein
MSTRRHGGFGGGSDGVYRRPYRGSRKRLKRIRFAENTSVDFWVFVALMIFLLCVVLPWLVNHPLPHPD